MYLRTFVVGTRFIQIELAYKKGRLHFEAKESEDHKEWSSVWKEDISLMSVFGWRSLLTWWMVRDTGKRLSARGRKFVRRKCNETR